MSKHKARREPDSEWDNLEFHAGFGNEFESEAVPGALPRGQNNPKVCPFGLYAEQVSGAPFTAPRASQRRTWLYRTRPSVTHEPFHPLEFGAENLGACFPGGGPAGGGGGGGGGGSVLTPNQIRWRPFAVPGADDPPVDFVRGLSTLCGAGSPLARSGYAVHVYAANASMKSSCLGNADGDMLIVPQLGTLRIRTEMGRMAVSPGEVAVVPAGIRFSVALKDEEAEGGGGGEKTTQAQAQAQAPRARGYVLEVFGTHFVLPELGPIGANGLAAPRDFLTPKAWYEDEGDEGEDEEGGGGEGEMEGGGEGGAKGDDNAHANDDNGNGCCAGEKPTKRARKERASPPSSPSSSSFTVIHKFGGELFSARQAFSPFNVVAWHGNYAPYKYDLSRFCPMNAVSFDHPDPSIFTVLTAPASPGSGLAGSAAGPPAADFVIFPPRYAVARNTFRPPYYHRNTMNEFMGLIRGGYDGKAGGGFLPGGASLHLAWTPHGPDKATFDAATARKKGKDGGIEEEENEVAPPAADGALAFMFEMHLTPRVSAAAASSPHVDREYYRCWEGLESHFDRRGAARAVAAARRAKSSSAAREGEGGGVVVAVEANGN